MAQSKGYHSAKLAPNRSKHHQIEIKLEDTDRPMELRELEIDGQVFGTPEETPKASS